MRPESSAERLRVRLAVSGVPAGVERVLLKHYRIDDTYGNSWSAWKKMGSPAAVGAAGIPALDRGRGNSGV